MPIQWGHAAFDAAARHVWAPRAGQQGLVAFLSDQEGIHSVLTHWLPAHLGSDGRSVPCCGDECQYHALPGSTEKAYAPVLLWMGTSRRIGGGFELPAGACPYDSLKWRPRVLEITSSLFRMLAQCQPGVIAWWYRPGEARNGRPKAYIVPGVKLAVTREMSFDVRPHLLNTWSMLRGKPTFGEEHGSAPAA